MVSPTRIAQALPDTLTPEERLDVIGRLHTYLVLTADVLRSSFTPMDKQSTAHDLRKGLVGQVDEEFIEELIDGLPETAGIVEQMVLELRKGAAA